jgi:hypothetical protein
VQQACLSPPESLPFVPSQPGLRWPRPSRSAPPPGGGTDSGEDRRPAFIVNGATGEDDCYVYREWDKCGDFRRNNYAVGGILLGAGGTLLVLGRPGNAAIERRSAQRKAG